MSNNIKKADFRNLRSKGYYCLITACIWLIHLFAWAQVKPDTANLLNNIQQPGKTTSGIVRKKDKIGLPSSSMPQEPGMSDTEQDANSQVGFEVNGLVFEGNTVFDSDQLLSVTGIVHGEVLSLSRLEEKVALITEHYRKAGFPLARAHIPEQVVENGIVKITVIEPQWGSLVVNNQSAIRDSVIFRTARLLRAGTLVQDKELESTAVYLSGLSGAQIQSELRAGDVPGTTDMVINAQPTKAMVGTVTADNFGSRYTGRERISTYVSWSNPFRSADPLTANVLSSGTLLNYQQLGYELPVWRPGVAIGITSTHMQYILGNGAESLMAHGHLKQQGYWFVYPLLATNDAKSDLRIQYEESKLNDHQDSTNTKNDRQLNKLSASVNLDRSDEWGNGGVTQINASLLFGRVFFNDAVAFANDAATAKTAGEFAKLNLRASRNQSIDPTWSVAATLDSQLSNHNLDATQKFSVGGFHSVRAYESGVMSADEAVFLSLECRARLPKPPAGFNISGEWYGAVFWDGAMTRVNKQPWSTSSNQATLRASGIGVYWQGPDNWRSSIAFASAIGALPDTLTSSGIASHNVWFELSKGWR